MDVWASQAVGLLWRNALAVVPLAALVAVICRCSRFRPATRHSLWLLVLLWFVAPLALPGLNLSGYWGASIPSGGAAAAPVDVPPTPTALSRSASPASVIPAPDMTLAAPTRRDAMREVAAPRHETSAADSQQSLPDGGARRLAVPRSDRVINPDPGRSETSRHDGNSGAPLSALRRGATPAKEDSRDVSRAADTAPIPDVEADDRIAALLEASKAAVAADCGGPESYRPQINGVPSAELRITPAAGTSIWNLPVWQSARGMVVDLWRSASVTVAEWAAAFQAARDRLGRLPAPPSAFWFGGLAGLMCVLAWRSMSFHARLERGRPAGAHVLRVVRSVARGMGLRSVPQTLVVSDRVSPMIWCGRRARLILPAELWNELDETGRRAIVAHELAHLRRGDHWVCRLALLLSGLFWWHPVLWWVRRRLNEEADLACDAWVTWLMPRERRAYAEALLRTKAYLSDQKMNVPAAGIGIASGRVRSMARRIKMVMTQTVRPRESMTGLALAAFLAVMGWAATPAWSFPGDEKCEKAAAGTASTAQGKGESASTPAGGSAPAALLGVAQQTLTGATAPLHASGGTLMLANLLDERGGKSGRAGTTDGSDDRDDLHRRVARLERQLEELRGAMHGGQGGRGLGGGRAAPPAVYAPAAPTPPANVGGLFGGAARGPGAFPGDGPRAASPLGGRAGGASSSNEVVIRAYKLPKRKLDAIFSLLGPDDVPLRVRKLDDAIEVHGSEREHEIFRAFIEIIHPDGAPAPAPQPRSRSRTSRRATGGTEAAPEALARDAYLAALAQTERQAAGVERLAELAAIESVHGATESAALGALLERAAAAEANSTGTRAQIEALGHQLEELARQSEEFEHQAGEMMRQAEEASERKAADADRQLERELKEKARAMEQQTRNLERQSRQVERQMRELERKAAEFEQRAEELREKAESLGDSSSESDDDSDDEADGDEEMSVEAPDMPEPAEIPDAPDAAEPGTPAPPAAGWTTTPALAPLPAGSPAAGVPATFTPIATAPHTPARPPTGR